MTPAEPGWLDSKEAQFPHGSMFLGFYADGSQRLLRYVLVDAYSHEYSGGGFARSALTHWRPLPK